MLVFQTKQSVTRLKIGNHVTTWLISAHARRVQGYIHCRYCVSEYTDMKLDDCDKHVRTDCKNDHSTSKVLGHVTRHSINLISTSGLHGFTGENATAKVLNHGDTVVS